MQDASRPRRSPARRRISALAATLAAGALASCQHVALAEQCSLVKTYDGRGVFKDADGLISFVADVDVNTDGALRSYHPDDPGYFNADGKLDTHFALNTVCNGVTIVDAAGKTLYGPGQCGTLLKEFARLRPLNWSDAAGVHVKWVGVASKGQSQPCIDQSGYFVSQTARALDPKTDECDPAHWPDALKLSSIVLPADAAMLAAGVKLGDLTVVREPSGRLTGAVFLDTNNTRLGEASVNVARVLRGGGPDPATYRAVLRLKLNEAEYFVFPGSGPQLGKLTNASEPAIQKLALKLAGQYGIKDRKACH